MYIYESVSLTDWLKLFECASLSTSDTGCLGMSTEKTWKEHVGKRWRLPGALFALNWQHSTSRTTRSLTKQEGRRKAALPYLATVLFTSLCNRSSSHSILTNIVSSNVMLEQSCSNKNFLSWLLNYLLEWVNYEKLQILPIRTILKFILI